MKSARLWLLLALMLPLCTQGQAGEVRPALLEIREALPALYDFLWKVPAQGAVGLDIEPLMPAGCHLNSDGGQQQTEGALMRRGRMQCTDGLAGKTIRIRGLEVTDSDVLVQVRHLDGRVERHLLSPVMPQATFDDLPPVGQRLLAYTWFGAKSFLSNPDHLLCAVGLLLLATGRRRLFGSLVAFGFTTAGALSLEVLGYVAPSAPVIGAILAMTVLYVALELARQALGGGNLSQRHPWMVALLLGIPHGFALSSGMTELGVRGREMLLALPLFGFGVLLVLLTLAIGILLLRRSTRSIEDRIPWFIAVMPAYLLGGVGAYWTLQRLHMLFGSMI